MRDLQRQLCYLSYFDHHSRCFNVLESTQPTLVFIRLFQHVSCANLVPSCQTHSQGPLTWYLISCCCPFTFHVPRPASLRLACEQALCLGKKIVRKGKGRLRRFIFRTEASTKSEWHASDTQETGDETQGQIFIESRTDVWVEGSPRRLSEQISV